LIAPNVYVVVARLLPVADKIAYWSATWRPAKYLNYLHCTSYAASDKVLKTSSS